MSSIKKKEYQNTAWWIKDSCESIKFIFFVEDDDQQYKKVYIRYKNNVSIFDPIYSNNLMGNNFYLFFEFFCVCAECLTKPNEKSFIIIIFFVCAENLIIIFYELMPLWMNEWSMIHQHCLFILWNYFVDSIFFCGGRIFILICWMFFVV